MYPYFNSQYPTVQPGGINFAPGNQGFQTAVPLPTQPQVNRPIIFGHPVTRPEDITANDVPMDGTSGYFPLSDGSAIYKKTWNSDGTITTTKFVPEVKEKEPIPKDKIDELREWLDERLKELAKPGEEAVG